MRKDLETNQQRYAALLNGNEKVKNAHNSNNKTTSSIAHKPNSEMASFVARKPYKKTLKYMTHMSKNNDMQRSQSSINAHSKSREEKLTRG